MRSINTSIIALLPVAAILFVGGGLLGAGELEDLALVLFVGMLSGTYSSIFIATPVLADLKEREPQYRALTKRVAVRASGGRAAKRTAARTPASARSGTIAADPDDDLASQPDDADLDAGAGAAATADELTATASRASALASPRDRPARATSAAPQKRQHSAEPPGRQEEAPLAR